MSLATSWREKLSVLFEGSHFLRLSQREFNCEVQTKLHPSAPSDRIREEVVVAKPLTPVRKSSIGVLLPPLLGVCEFSQAPFLFGLTSNRLESSAIIWATWLIRMADIRLRRSRKEFVEPNHPDMRMIGGMNALAPKLVALFAAVVLALPPGLCCGMSDVSAKASEPTSCCYQATHSSLVKHHPAPAQPKANCCCSLRAATPTSSVQAPDSATVSGIFYVPLLNSPVAADPAFSTVPVVTRTGPPLHALLCVWRN